MEWLTKTAAEQGRAIASGALDPVALAEAYLDAARQHPLAERIYARMTEDRARAEAVAAHDRAKAGYRLGPLDGVPISWKDLFDTAGVETAAGSALLEGRVPDRDAEVLRVATAQGLVCLGKTHMSELAFSGLGLNPVTATSPNVHNPALISGGSSSGAAASVAHGLAAGGIGSDTGGSVRIPAAWNDLVGLKTTAGRVSLKGVVPLCLEFDTVGPLTRSVEDAALLLAALEGTPAVDLRGAGLKGAHFLILDTVAFDDIEDAPRDAFDASVDALTAAGARVTRRAVPGISLAMTLTAALFPSEGYGLWRNLIEAAPEKMFAEVLERFRIGADVSAPDYVAAWATLREVRAEYYAATVGFDAVIMPASPILPAEIARLESDHAHYIERNLMALRNTRIGNLMGSAALTLPTGVASCGFMMVTPPGSEERLLRLGSAVEAVLA